MTLLAKFSPIHSVLLLRSIAILLQIALVLFVNIILNYQLPLLPISLIIAVEILFTVGSYYYFNRMTKVDNSALFFQIFADVNFLALLLYFSGGATNAFVSLLLIPLALAAVTLPFMMLIWLALAAVTAYSVLLWLLPMHVMHGNMEGHFIGMWINFLLSTAVVVVVVSKLAKGLNKRELAIAAYREEQLKQEKIVALGVAATQITHELATPLATVNLLTEELLEDDPDNPVLVELQTELLRCNNSISTFRSMVVDIKDQITTTITSEQLMANIQQHICLQHPDINAYIQINNDVNFDEGDQVSGNMQEQTLTSLNSSSVVLTSNAALLPAILNLINNAVRASKANNSSAIVLNCANIANHRWQLSIRDFGKGFNLTTLEELGASPVDSTEGLGVAVLLSHSSLEKLGGKLELTNHVGGGALVTLSLPVESLRG